MNPSEMNSSEPQKTQEERAEEERFRRALFESGRLLSQNRPGEALQKLQPLYEKIPTNPDVAINVGGAYILQRKWDRAVKVLAKATDAHPTNPVLWMNLGAALLGPLEIAGPDQQTRAIKAFEKVIQLAPTTPNVHYQLGLIYKMRGEINHAMAFFQRALEVNPADKDANYWLEKITEKET